MKRLGIVGVLATVTSAYADRPELQPPAPEVVRAQTKVELPAVPAFEVPQVEAGVHDPRELRVQGGAVLDREIKVKGYVVWIYDCARAIATAGEAPRDVQARIDADPTLCERPRFFVGATKDTPPERAIWVVDVPRVPNKLELARLPKAELAAWPKVPKVAVGDYVVVAGTWRLASPHGTRNSDGLLVFESLAPGGKPPVNALPREKHAEPPEAAPPPIGPPAVAAEVEPRARAQSVAELNACSAAIGARKLDDAAARCTRALQLWPGNHLAWYSLGIGASARGDWAGAKTAYENALKLRPDSAQYQMVTGVALYETGAASYDAAREHLRTAVAIEPAMWRAHYYLGRALRGLGRVRAAADELGRTIALNPAEPGPYIALAELYRKWDYVDESIAVATQGTKVVSGAGAADVWLEVGLGYDDKRQDQLASEAFAHALDLVPANYKARFQRGQSLYRLKDYAKARAELEEVMKSAPASESFVRQQAQAMLLAIATASAKK